MNALKRYWKISQNLSTNYTEFKETVYYIYIYVHALREPRINLNNL